MGDHHHHRGQPKRRRLLRAALGRRLPRGQRLHHLRRAGRRLQRIGPRRSPDGRRGQRQRLGRPDLDGRQRQPADHCQPARRGLDLPRVLLQADSRGGRRPTAGRRARGSGRHRRVDRRRLLRARRAQREPDRRRRRRPGGHADVFAAAGAAVAVAAAVSVLRLRRVRRDGVGRRPAGVRPVHEGAALRRPGRDAHTGGHDAPRQHAQRRRRQPRSLARLRRPQDRRALLRRARQRRRQDVRVKVAVRIRCKRRRRLLRRRRRHVRRGHDRDELGGRERNVRGRQRAAVLGGRAPAAGQRRRGLLRDGLLVRQLRHLDERRVQLQPAVAAIADAAAARAAAPAAGAAARGLRGRPRVLRVRRRRERAGRVRHRRLFDVRGPRDGQARPRVAAAAAAVAARVAAALGAAAVQLLRAGRRRHRRRVPGGAPSERGGMRDLLHVAFGRAKPAGAGIQRAHLSEWNDGRRKHRLPFAATCSRVQCAGGLALHRGEVRPRPVDRQGRKFVRHTILRRLPRHGVPRRVPAAAAALARSAAGAAGAWTAACVVHRGADRGAHRRDHRGRDDRRRKHPDRPHDGRAHRAVRRRRRAGGHHHQPPRAAGTAARYAHVRLRRRLQRRRVRDRPQDDAHVRDCRLRRGAHARGGRGDPRGDRGRNPGDQGRHGRRQSVHRGRRRRRLRARLPAAAALNAAARNAASVLRSSRRLLKRGDVRDGRPERPNGAGVRRLCRRQRPIWWIGRHRWHVHSLPVGVLVARHHRQLLLCHQHRQLRGRECRNLRGRDGRLRVSFAKAAAGAALAAAALAQPAAAAAALAAAAVPVLRADGRFDAGRLSERPRPHDRSRVRGVPHVARGNGLSRQFAVHPRRLPVVAQWRLGRAVRLQPVPPQHRRLHSVGRRREQPASNGRLACALLHLPRPKLPCVSAAAAAAAAAAAVVPGRDPGLPLDRVGHPANVHRRLRRSGPLLHRRRHPRRLGRLHRRPRADVDDQPPVHLPHPVLRGRMGLSRDQRRRQVLLHQSVSHHTLPLRRHFQRQRRRPPVPVRRAAGVRVHGRAASAAQQLRCGQRRHLRGQRHGRSDGGRVRASGEFQQPVAVVRLDVEPLLENEVLAARFDGQDLLQRARHRGPPKRRILQARVQVRRQRPPARRS